MIAEGLEDVAESNIDTKFLTNIQNLCTKINIY